VERGRQLSAVVRPCTPYRFTGVFLKNPPLDMVLSAPTQVHLAVTNACNSRCGHCFASSGQPYADELTTFEIKRLIDDLAEMGCFKIKFGGGAGTGLESQSSRSVWRLRLIS
jgi:2-iminoacetate synthase ThiH